MTTKSKVFFIDFRATYKENLMRKIDRLLDAAGLSQAVKARDLVAIKLHFGELGNSAFIRPVFIRNIVASVKAIGGIPFLTDSNTLYAGTRSNAPSHIITAIQNGFAYPVTDAPIIIADGLRGKNETIVKIRQKHFEQVYIGSDIVHADCLLSIGHFKCHPLTGFAGSLKNIGMGCASRKGKLQQHSKVNPKVKRKKCKGCGECTTHCSQNAITLTDKKAFIHPEKCIGCGECILICANDAVQIQWNPTIPLFMERMMEYALGALTGKVGRSLFLNFITDVSPACDCEPYNDAPIVRNIGILASTDPVAIDQASVDLVNEEHALPGSCLKTHLESGEDKFKGLYPKADWEIQMNYAETLGVGNRRYELLPI